MKGLLMEENKIPVVCTDDNIAYYDVTDASWDKEVFITSILDCCNGNTRGTYNTSGCWKEKEVLDATHWKYYDKSMEGMVTWKQC